MDYVPVGAEEWAVYEVPEETLEAFSHELMTTTGINTHTITKPVGATPPAVGATIFSLNSCVDCVMENKTAENFWQL